MCGGGYTRVEEDERERERKRERERGRTVNAAKRVSNVVKSVVTSVGRGCVVVVVGEGERRVGNNLAARLPRSSRQVRPSQHKTKNCSVKFHHLCIVLFFHLAAESVPLADAEAALLQAEPHALFGWQNYRSGERGMRRERERERARGMRRDR